MKIEVESLKQVGALKCPRCWRYCGIADNALELCDRCCVDVLEGWDGHVLAEEVKRANAFQVEKFRKILL